MKGTAMKDDDPKECCECGKTTGKLHKITWTEQEYPGASYWTWTDYFCPDCVKFAPRSQPIRELHPSQP